MRKSASTPKVQSANSTCRLLGHEWMSTAAANFRVCTRKKCRASERLVDGAWVSNAQAYRTHTPVIASERRARQQHPQQITMWNSDQQCTPQERQGKA